MRTLLSKSITATPSGLVQSQLLKRSFVRLGVLPFLLVIALVTFSFLSSSFLTVSNLTNVVRQSVFLAIVSMGQMMVLLTGGFDLSVGTILALTSVATAMAMATLAQIFPDSIFLIITLGCLAGLAVGTIVGVINGLGVAFLNVAPFIMTLGIASTGFGIALSLTGGTPVYGMPMEFGNVFGFGTFLSIPVPIWIAALVVLLTWGIVNMTRYGRALYAVGGNPRAAMLSGIDTRKTQFLVYVVCAFLASIAGVLLTARLDTGEANIGSSMPLESIAACVIAGVSLRGGVGKVGSVALGAVFISLVQNGMNLARIDSYMQTVVIGLILIAAVVADQLRLRYIADLRGS
ncbi:monosaccharide ABC transporter membrane protein, CUT2 family [Roseovarius pacificus]|uniref:Monosaccharide ABC transporter membrane protein, CUT2 family n=1 Tax=Roseovarius pacificus TaxID=337701 RepID=A0A1M7KNY4_9RHOB|nr:ABC transporter permease [Roseovarius pacificus]GGO62843.1 ABC transporter permease [Roseovarius pacificus]SHM67205.1 monosaccharide ABC transporter membrane protein, CUT2 family [Roseovarius pacificus]